MKVTLDPYATLLSACAVLLAGRWLVRHVGVLARLSIPDPVAGGLSATLIVAALHAAGVTVEFQTTLQMPLLLAFFCTIGLTSNIAVLRRGGRMLVRFVVVVVGFLILQDVVGIGTALALGYHPLLGLIGGSITLAGGYGTGAAWGAEFAARHGLGQALPLAMACATFGLILGGIVGGPVAQLLVRRLQKRGQPLASGESTPVEQAEVFEAPEQDRRITTGILVETLFLMAIALTLGTLLEWLTAGTAWSLPDFVWVLFVGVLVGNALRVLRVYKLEERAVSVIGNLCLDLFLALALMSLRLWELSALAGPLLILMALQTVAMVAYVRFVSFPVMGGNYDAAVLGAGQVGFGLGATPTAIANIQAVTARYGASHIAFLLVPIVGAFFLDLANAVVIKAFLTLPLLR